MLRAMCLRARAVQPICANASKFHVSAPLMKSKLKKGDYIPEGYSKIKLTQAKFQLDDGLPVFLKGGPRDMFLYKTTMILAIIGVLWGLAFVASLIAESIPVNEDQAKFEADAKAAETRDC